MHPLSSNLYSSVRHLIENAKSKIVRNINMTMIMTYFQIGEIIVEDEQSGRDRAEYSKETLKNLSKQLIEEFGRGYSVDNLQWMRKFYLMFQKRISQEVNDASGKYETLSRISAEDSNYESPSRNSVFTLS